jgi:predicted AAA+ superfamily ATPase
MLTRQEYDVLRRRLGEPRKFIQVVLGPRQIGKTTVVRQVLHDINKPQLYFSADDTAVAGSAWLASCWTAARLEAQTHPDAGCVLVIDEIQKVPNWSETVKRQWDDDTWNERNIKVVLLGSSRALILQGLSESLMGRFEEIRMTHWTYAEMRDCFGLTVDEFIYFGGYPGAVEMMQDEARWKVYVRNSMIDATVNRDIFEDVRIGKAALLRKTLELGAAYSGKILSLTKLLGEIQDAGNVMTIAGYLERLNQCGLLGTFQKFSVDDARRRASIPKFQVHNNALLTALSAGTFEQVRNDPVKWGHYVESAVGAYLISQAYRLQFEVFYWRDGNNEVDFVLRKDGKVVALEVKSNHERYTKGLDVFCQKFRPNVALIVGSGGLPLETFLETPITDLF